MVSDLVSPIQNFLLSLCMLENPFNTSLKPQPLLKVFFGFFSKQHCLHPLNSSEAKSPGN